MTRARRPILMLLFGLGLSIGLATAANADLVAGGWLDKPKAPPTPPPQATEPPPPVVPIVRPRPVARPRPAQPQHAPANAPPSDGSVRF